MQKLFFNFNCLIVENGPVGVIVPVENQPNKFVVGSGRDFLLVTWDGESNVADLPYEKLASVESDRTDTRFNDGKCDSAGRIWLGSSHKQFTPFFTFSNH